MLKQLRYITAFLYDLFISTFFTVAAHLALLPHMTLSSGNFLDVGCGTGRPLQTIVDKIKQKHPRVVGIDLHPEYTEKAIHLFEKDSQVEIYQMDFYKMEDVIKQQFRFIFFSFSFMLLPDPLKALEVAKRVLQRHPDSRISFVLTLNKSKNSFLSRIKPLIKRFTTIDFGEVVSQDSLLSLIEQIGLEPTKKVRIQSKWNIFLKLAPVYYIECKVKNVTQ